MIFAHYFLRSEIFFAQISFLFLQNEICALRKIYCNKPDGSEILFSIDYSHPMNIDSSIYSSDD